MDKLERSIEEARKNSLFKQVADEIQRLYDTEAFKNPDEHANYISDVWKAILNDNGITHVDYPSSASYGE